MAGRNRVRYNGHPAWDRLDPETWPSEALNGDRARAKQVEMLQADLEHAVQWVDTMQALVDEHLPDEEFTVRRLTALKDWEKSRHRVQKALHYRYDPLQRPKHLIERDTGRALQAVLAKRNKIRSILDERGARVEGELATVNALRGSPAPKVAPRIQQDITPVRVGSSGLHAGLASLDRLDRQMFQDLDPDTDLATTHDDGLRQAWKTRNPGMTDELIDTVIAKINGLVKPQ